ncbi:MAG: response regulator [Sulfurimonas sp.]
MRFLENYTLLYIEDKEEIRNNYGNYFKNVFGDVYLASSAEEGLALYKVHKPQVLIADISLKGMDGWIQFNKTD